MLGHRHSQLSWGGAPVSLVDGERELLKEVWGAGRRTDRFKRTWDLWFLEPLVVKKRWVYFGINNTIKVLITTTYCFSSHSESYMYFCHLVCPRGSAQVCFWELCQKRSLCKQEQELLLSTKFWLRKDSVLGKTGYSRVSKGTKIKKEGKTKAKPTTNHKPILRNSKVERHWLKNANYRFIRFFFSFSLSVHVCACASMHACV